MFTLVEIDNRENAFESSLEVEELLEVLPDLEGKEIQIDEGEVTIFEGILTEDYLADLEAMLRTL